MVQLHARTHGGRRLVRVIPRFGPGNLQPQTDCMLPSTTPTRLDPRSSEFAKRGDKRWSWPAGNLPVQQKRSPEDLGDPAGQIGGTAQRLMHWWRCQSTTATASTHKHVEGVLGCRAVGDWIGRVRGMRDRSLWGAFWYHAQGRHGDGARGGISGWQRRCMRIV